MGMDKRQVTDVYGNPAPEGDSVAEQPMRHYLRPAWRCEWFSILAMVGGLYLMFNPLSLPFFDLLQRLLVESGWQMPLATSTRFLGLLVVLLYGLTALWNRYRWRYMVGPAGVESVRGLIGRDERRAEYRNITYVRLRQGVLQRLFGIGDLLIGTSATDEPEVVFRGIANPRRWKKLVHERQQKMSLLGA